MEDTSCFNSLLFKALVLPLYPKSITLARAIGKWIFVICIAISGSYPSLADVPGSRTTIVIAATSDLHGWLSTNSMFPHKKPRGILHVGPIIEKLREEHPQLILLDAGDTLQGSPANFYFNYNTLSDRPLPIIKLMNRLRYDAMVLGNHDLEPPLAVLEKNRRSSHFPWLAANLLNKDGVPFLPPYHILERQGVRVGILGLITPGTPMWVDDSHLENLEFQDMFEATQKWLPVLKEKNEVDLVIGLFHSGHNAGYDQWASLNEGVPLANAAGLVADYQEGMDLIISGHSHRIYPKRRTDDLRNFRVPVVSPGSWGEGVSVIKFFLEKDQGKWQTKGREFEFIQASSTFSEKLQKLVSQDMERVHRYLETPTAVELIAQPDRDVFYQCGAALSHQVLTVDSRNSMLSLLPRWKWHEVSSRELRNPLKRLHLFRWLPYDNFLVQAGLFGKQIRILLKSYQRMLEDKRFRSSALLLPGGFQAELQNDQVPLALKLMQDEETMPSSELFQVWLTNYHWNGGGGMRGEALIHASQKVLKTQQTLRDLVFSYLQTTTSDLPSICATFLKKTKAF